MQNIVSLAKRRGFVYPGSSIYGGLANSWDYGPYGVSLRKNIKDLWWQRFVVQRDNIIGIDAALIMNSKVWEASGHIAGFSDALVDCKECKARIRADHLVENALNKKVEGKTMLELGAIIKKHKLKCPECSSNKLTTPRQFNLMFKTAIGTVEDKASRVYLRPETAQGIFVNFKNILDSVRVKVPFGIAQIGKAFRNEITPGNFIFRVLEFEQMEIEYFIRESDWKKSFTSWQKEMTEWLEFIGISKKNYAVREHTKDELSHYSKRTVDFEYKFPFGTKELYGLAYRTDFDLRAHAKQAKLDLTYIDPHTKEKFIPHVIEPTFGVERTFLAVLCDAYTEEDDRVVLKLDHKLAPVKIAVFPLLRNKLELVEKARAIFDTLKAQWAAEFDDHGNVGKRYRRQDEIGTPFTVTIDFETLESDTVTIRDRDTMKQERVKVEDLKKFFKKKFNYSLT